MASGLAALSNSISNYIKGVGAELGIVSDNSGNNHPEEAFIKRHLASFNNSNWK